MQTLIEPSFTEVTIAKSVQLGCVTLFFYCCFLHLDEEIQFIWGKRWSFGKVFYFLSSRYSGTAFLLYANITTLHLRWYNPGINSLPLTGDPDIINRGPLNSFCSILGHLYTGPGLLVVSLAEVVLMLRVYAMYEKGKGILVTLLILFTLSITYTVYQTIGPSSQHKFPCFGTCENPDLSLGCTLDSDPVSYIGWLFLSLVELVLFMLVISKYGRSRRRGLTLDDWSGGMPRRRDISTVMAQDSTRYFALIFTVCLLGFILAIISELPNTPTPVTTSLQYQLNTYQTIVIAVMSFLAPQLLISVRKEYYYALPMSERDLTWKVVEVSTCTSTREREC